MACWAQERVCRSCASNLFSADFQAQLFDAITETFFFFFYLNSLCVCVNMQQVVYYPPVIILLRTLFIAAIKIMVWSFEEDLASVLHHSLDLLKILGFGGDDTGGAGATCAPAENKQS